MKHLNYYLKYIHVFRILYNIIDMLSIYIDKVIYIYRYATLRYATLRYAMLCYAMLCYAMLCYATLRHATLRYATLRYATLCYVMLCYAMLCYAMLCYAMLCYAMLCYTILYYTILYYTIPSIVYSKANRLIFTHYSRIKQDRLLNIFKPRTKMEATANSTRNSK